MGGRWWRFLHWVVVANLVLGAAYAGYMVFFVVGGGAPLFRRARDLPFEVLVARRLYAIEAWVILAGLSVYLGVTEILPRKLSGGGGGAKPDRPSGP